MPEYSDHLERCRVQIRNLRAELARIKAACPHPESVVVTRTEDIPEERGSAYDYKEINFCTLCGTTWEDYR